MTTIYHIEVNVSHASFYIRVRKPIVIDGRLVNFTMSNHYPINYNLWLCVLHLVAVLQYEMDLIK